MALAVFVGGVALAGCDSQTNASTISSDPPPPLIRDATPPSAAGAMAPNLSRLSDGRILLSWLEPRGAEHALRVAIHDGVRWSAPRDVAHSDRFFVNWADFPSIVAGPKGLLVAHWLEKSGEGTYAYDVRISRSTDEGKTWTASSVLHDDRTQTEHGFVSLVSDPAAGAVAAAWLDGRKMEGGHGHAGEMSLRFARLLPDGTKVSEAELDGRTCECCQTGMAITSSGPVIVYRDRSLDETRDIALVRWTGNGWSKPTVVHRDGWKIAGCPVNGPQVDARNERVAVAWFTEGGEAPRVLVAFSDDAANSFRKAVPVDDGKPLGRVDVELLEDGSALVTWLERGAAGAEVKIRKVRGNGVRGSSVTVGTTNAARSAGFPRVVMAKETAWVAWTEAGQTSRIRSAMVHVKGLNR